MLMIQKNRFQNATLEAGGGEPVLHVLARVEIVWQSTGTGHWHGQLIERDIALIAEKFYILTLEDGRSGPILVNEVRGSGNNREAFFVGTGPLTT